jgi:hypothetical protein
VKRALVPALISIACAGCATGRVIPWAPAAMLRLPDRSAYPDAHAVYLLRERRVEMAIVGNARPRAHVRWRRHDAIVILDEKGRDMTRVPIVIEPKERLVSFVARAIDPNGNVHAIEPTDVREDAPSSDDPAAERVTRVTRTLAFSSLAPGWVLEYQYNIEANRRIDSFSEYIVAPIPVVHYRLYVELGRDIVYSAVAYNDDRPWTITKDDQVTKLSWSADDVPAAMSEDFAPELTLREPWWRLRVLQYPWGTEVYDANRTWSTAMRGAADRIYFDPRHDYDRFETPLIAGCADPVCRIAFALDQLRELAPFSGFSGKEFARPVAQVLASKSANNFEKARLLRRMLAVAGVQADFAYAFRFLSARFDRDAPISWFDHLLLRVPAQKDIVEPTWIDPSCEFCRAGELPDWDQGVEAMVVHATKGPLDGWPTVEPEWITLAAPNPVESTYRATLDTWLDPKGNASVDVGVRATGECAQDISVSNRQLPYEGQRLLAEAWGRMASNDAKLGRVTPITWTRGATMSEHAVSYQVDAYAELEGDRLRVPLTMLPTNDDRIFDTEQRVNDIDILGTRVREETAVIHIPQGFKLAHVPKATRIETPAIVVEVRSTADRNKAQVTRTLLKRRGHFARASYPEMKQAMDAYRAVRSSSVTLVRDQLSR